MLPHPPTTVQITRIAFVALLVSLGMLLTTWALPQANPPTPPTPVGQQAHRLPATAEEKLSSDDHDAQLEGATELIARGERDWPDDHRRDFLADVTPHALRSAAEHCIPPSITVAQAVLESAWGRSSLARSYNNLFGVKSGGDPEGVVLPTTEFDGVPTTDRFRTYDDWRESIAHHDRLLASDPRYARSLERWDDWPRFVEALAPVYATDPAYARKVSALVEAYRLDRWDGLVQRAATRRADCPRPVTTLGHG